MLRSATRDRDAGLGAGERALVTNSATVAGWTLVSRVTGFGRMAAIAAVLGPTFFGNLFQTANQIPILTFELIAGQLIASMLVPALVRHLDGQDRFASERVAGGFLGIVLALFVAGAALLAIGAPLVLRLIGLGVEDDATRAAQLSLGWPLLALVMPQLPLYGLVGIANAVQNARGRYALAAAAPALENLGVIATLVAYALLAGRGTDLASATSKHVIFLGVGSTLSVVVHAALQWWGAKRAGVTLVPRNGWKDPEVRAVTKLAVPSLGLAALTGYQNFALIVAAGAIAGGVVASQLALGFLLAAVAVSARPVAVASLPTLARLHRDRRNADFRAEYLRSLLLALFVLAPAAALLAALGRPLASAVAFGEMADPNGIGLLAAIIPALAIGVIGEGGITIATQASYARLDTRSPLHAAAIRAVVLTVGLGIAFTVPRGTALMAALGISVSVANTVSFMWLHRAALRTSARTAGAGEAPFSSTSTLRRMTATASIAAVAGASGWATNRLTAPWFGTRAALVVAALVLGAVYLGFQLLLGAPEIAALARGDGTTAKQPAEPKGRAPGRVAAPRRSTGPRRTTGEVADKRPHSTHGKGNMDDHDDNTSADGFRPVSWPLDLEDDAAHQRSTNQSALQSAPHAERTMKRANRLVSLAASMRNTGQFDDGATTGDLDVMAIMRGIGTVIAGVALALLNPAVTLVILTVAVTAWLLLRSGSNSHLGSLQPIDAVLPTTCALAALAGLFPLVTGVAALLTFAVFRGASLGPRERTVGIGIAVALGVAAALVGAVDRSPTPLAATVPVAIVAWVAIVTRTSRQVARSQIA